VAQSFSKNFGLYGQRVGALHVAVASTSPKDVSEKLLANLCRLVRGEYSMAPRGGAEIVKTVLGDENLREKWLEDLTTMSERIRQMRHALFDELVKLGTPGDWNHITNQVSYFHRLFSDLGLIPFRSACSPISG
jgi:aspartate aminotransferase